MSFFPQPPPISLTLSFIKGASSSDALRFAQRLVHAYPCDVWSQAVLTSLLDSSLRTKYQQVVVDNGRSTQFLTGLASFPGLCACLIPRPMCMSHPQAHVHVSSPGPCPDVHAPPPSERTSGVLNCHRHLPLWNSN